MNRRKSRLETATDAFAERAYDIVVACDETPKRGTTPFQSRWGKFKREAYNLIRRTKSEPGGHNVIKAIIRREKCEPAYLFYEGNEFHWGLLAMDPHHVILDDKRISLFARQLAYADLHDVPAHLLVGFLYQSGPSASIAKKLKAGAREPWFGGGLT